MKPLLNFAALAGIAALLFSPQANAQSRAQYEAMIAAQASANNVPESLVHRVIVRESRYQPSLVGRGGTIGLMQIKLATARGLGYTGTAEGLRNPETNLAWGIKYLAGAYRAAGSDHSRRRALLCERLLLCRQAPAAGAQPPRPATGDCAAIRRLAGGGGNKPCRRLRATGSRQIACAAGLHVDSSAQRLTLDAFRGELRGGAEIPLIAVTL
jgi:Transglycosylase SLT domain